MSSTPGSPIAGSDPLPDAVDVVVIGGGAAGCVVASRLSEDSHRTVLLIEAGPSAPDDTASIPGEVMSVLASTAVVHEPTTAQVGLDGRPSTVPVARVLGGGSAVNFMTWMQGSPQDFDGWAASGADGWDWESVRPTLRQLEDHELGASTHHGAGGPIAVSTSSHFETLHLAFLEAWQQTGVRVSDDLNGAARWGVGLNQANIRDGRRHSVIDGYLATSRTRTNLAVRTGLSVERVILSGGRATGVRVAGREVRADTVVLCAGALRTPQLLMLSGIGPAAALREHGISVVQDLPGVGENLHDHVFAAPVWEVLHDRTLLDAHDPQSLTTYGLVRRGPLSNFCPVTTLLPLDGSDAADMQFLPALIGFGPDMMPLPDRAMSVISVLLTPFSRGRVRLRSRRPDDQLDVDPGYLTDPRDLPRLRAGVQRLFEVFGQPALAGVTGRRLAPASELDEEQFDSYLRHNAHGFWHPVGTARMGSDDGSVVDPGLAVHGIENLFVADASVMPSITRGTTQAPTLMIAERAARLLAH